MVDCKFNNTLYANVCKVSSLNLQKICFSANLLQIHFFVPCHRKHFPCFRTVLKNTAFSEWKITFVKCYFIILYCDKCLQLETLVIRCTISAVIHLFIFRMNRFPNSLLHGTLMYNFFFGLNCWFFLNDDGNFLEYNSTYRYTLYFAIV